MGTPKDGAADTATAMQRRIWDKVAPQYDRQIGFFERVWFTGGREWIGARARGRVLEVAVGTGRSLPFYRPGVTLTGVDLSPGMLGRARDRARSSEVATDLRVEDATELPFADATFDTVVCGLALCSIPDPAAAIGEMCRVLVPNGQLLLLDHVGSTFPPLFAAQWLVERVALRAAGEHLTRRQRPLVEAAGLEIAESERLKLGTIERIRATKKPAG